MKAVHERLLNEQACTRKITNKHTFFFYLTEFLSFKFLMQMCALGYIYITIETRHEINIKSCKQKLFSVLYFQGGQANAQNSLQWTRDFR